MRVVAALLLFTALPLVAADPVPAPKLAPLWFVHIDRVEKSNAPRFEELVRKQISTRESILAEHHVVLPQVWEIATSAGEYLSFRPRASMSDFDKPSPVPPAVKTILDARVYSMDDSIHATIRDHHSEIWDFDEDSSFLRVPLAAPSAARLERFRVRADKRDDYNKLLLKLRDAAEKNGGTSLLVFWPGFGDGSDVLLWTAAKGAVPSREALLTAAFGSEEAPALLRQWNACVVDLREDEALPRPDLTATAAATWLR